MRELVELLARALVDDPDGVQVTETTRGENVILELKVAPSDLGKIIGRQGRTARALRTIVAAAGEKVGRQTVFDILE